jgi:hypothetical protein
MTTTKHKLGHRRGAKPAARRKSKGYRNAAPRFAPSRSAASKAPIETALERLGQLVPTALGMGAASIGGALATRWGFHPQTVAIGLGLAGVGLAAKAETREWQRAGLGAFSAGGSQFILQALRKSPQPPSQVASRPAPARKNAELGALPPGALDAAFERARAELAVSGDPYAHEHDHMGRMP